MPKIKLQANFAAKHTAFGNFYAGGNISSGYNFDAIPVGVNDPDQAINELNNFDLTNVATGSRMIMFGTHPDSVAQIVDNPHPCGYKTTTNANRGTTGDAGYGTGLYRSPEVFTASMITPNWIYTNTQDSTIQTFDIQLLWGDTSEQVDSTVGNPVQFSIIASP